MLFQSLPVALAICLTACAPTVRPSADVNARSIDRETARELSDGFESALVKNDRKYVYSKLERTYRDAVSERQFNSTLDQIDSAYGKVLAFEFKQDEVGTKEYETGETKPMRKFWYAITTTKFQKGSHFSIIEVVEDGTSLAVSSFSVVSFPAGVPSNLK